MSIALDLAQLAPAPVFLSAGRRLVSPALELPAAQQLLRLPIDARRLLASFLRQLAAQAAGKFEKSLLKNKIYMVAYWSDVSFHARFCARALARIGGAAASPALLVAETTGGARSSQAVVRNPVLALPAAQQAFGLPPASRRLLGSLLRSFGEEARAVMTMLIGRRRFKWASYFHAMAVYAKHIARVVDPR